GEESGDRLGGAVMAALRRRLGPQLRFDGVGGRAMAAQGLASRFPIDHLAIVGFSAIPRRLPAILRSIRAAAAAAVAAQPDVLVIIDSPDFTHRVARRGRPRAPPLPLLGHVSPSACARRARPAPPPRGPVGPLAPPP